MQNSRRSLGRQVSNHSGMSSISPKARGDRSTRSQMRASFPSIVPASPSEPLRGEMYKDLHERYLDLHKEVSQSKCELQRLRKEYTGKVGDGRVIQGLQAEVDLDRKRSLELVNALKKIQQELNSSESREKKAAIMRKHLHAISEWNPRITSLLRFVESQVTLTMLPVKKQWIP